jgi:dTDP-4-dehydrorhamnose 3,5-epimerase
MSWESFLLSSSNRTQILVPPGFAIGYLVLSESAIFHYKQSTYYDRESQFTIQWDDPRANIFWPIKETIRSPRDTGTPTTP